jgi:hypothetical protein
MVTGRFLRRYGGPTLLGAGTGGVVSIQDLQLFDWKRENDSRGGTAAIDAETAAVLYRYIP